MSRVPVYDADMIRIALESADIPAEIQDEIVNVTLPLEGPALNAARVAVPADCVERARLVMEQMGFEPAKGTTSKATKAANVYVRGLILLIAVAALGGALSGVIQTERDALIRTVLCSLAMLGMVIWSMLDLRRLKPGTTPPVELHDREGGTQSNA